MKVNIQILLLTCIMLIPLQNVCSQTNSNSEKIMVAAREIIKKYPYCSLVTVDSSGQPHARTMNPFPIDNEFVTWFATSRNSRKLVEIMNNSKVCIYFANHIAAEGYVSITGNAEIIDDKDLLIKMKRNYWNNIPNWQNEFVLIKIVPQTMEVISYKNGLINDSITNCAPSIKF